MEIKLALALWGQSGEDWWRKSFKAAKSLIKRPPSTAPLREIALDESQLIPIIHLAENLIAFPKKKLTEISRYLKWKFLLSLSSTKISLLVFRKPPPARARTPPFPCHDDIRNAPNPEENPK